MSASDFAPTQRTTVRRLPKRGVYDRAAVFAILDEALVCHVGFARDGQPFVIPTIFARLEDRLYVHGSAASRMLDALSEGVDACVTVTLVDGLVLARSAFHHSMNYRSVVVLGRARLVTDADEKRAALEAIVEHVVPGRSRDVRAPSEKELLATSVLRRSRSRTFSASTRSALSSIAMRGSVRFPSRRSLALGLPVTSGAPNVPSRSSAIWNATPRGRAYADKASSSACGPCASVAPRCRGSSNV